MEQVRELTGFSRGWPDRPGSLFVVLGQHRQVSGSSGWSQRIASAHRTPSGPLPCVNIQRMTCRCESRSRGEPTSRA